MPEWLLPLHIVSESMAASSSNYFRVYEMFMPRWLLALPIISETMKSSRQDGCYHPMLGEEHWISMDGRREMVVLGMDRGRIGAASAMGRRTPTRRYHPYFWSGQGKYMWEYVWRQMFVLYVRLQCNGREKSSYCCLRILRIYCFKKVHIWQVTNMSQYICSKSYFKREFCPI